MQHPHPKLFKLSDNASQDLPVYVLRDGNLFRTAFHPQGWSVNRITALKPTENFTGLRFMKMEHLQHRITSLAATNLFTEPRDTLWVKIVSRPLNLRIRSAYILFTLFWQVYQKTFDLNLKI